ncbi:efflux RND transporter periplasmic adaptor subunit [Granulosicoccus sp. 3-233]|uniref:efflux RND transporter periplasmic adaptor subunit n=1 Tax=Granulosicoccus sp. 3-233 TaxID=3417969 RepID=UPI003D341668
MNSHVRKHSDHAAPVSSKELPAPEIAALHVRAVRAERLAGHQAMLLGVLAELLASNTLQGALDALAAALKARFDCDRVAVALADGKDLTLAAISQQAVLDASSSEARLLVDAMRETCAQESIVCWPPTSDSLGVLAAHRALAGRRVSCAICSVPLYDKQKLIGVFLLERRERRAFPVAALERLSVGLAPVLDLHQQADRSWWAVLRRRCRATLQRYLGGERPGMRALAGLAVIVLLGSFVVTMPWHIVASAELLSHERRLVTAPQNGFVADMLVVAGDRVNEGQVMARLDPRELQLEIASRDSDIAMADAEFRAAMASYDRQATGIARARLAQARARREGVEQRLSRTELVSPMDGIVIAAEASRTSGSAVTRGETLFEIAPNADFEVHVLVDEADVYDVFEGQLGTLSLRAMPRQSLPIVVESVYPVAEAKDGRNRFRVKASLSEPESRLRPGQSGVARLQAGRMSAMGVLTRRFNRALAELWWRWVG